MGNPKERTGPLTEKRIEVSLVNSELVIPFHFGRQPVASEAMQAKLDRYAIAGARVMHPSWSDLSDEESQEELNFTASYPEEKAPYQSLGLVLSQEGFVRFDQPFKSFADAGLRDVFRAIADPLVEERYYNPAQIARASLFNPEIKYDDSLRRDWDAGELMSHLTIALAERGRLFNTKWDEHAPRISAVYRWPADLAEMLGLAYLLGEGRIKEEVTVNVKNRMRENLDHITHLVGFSEEDQARIAAQANDLAGSKVLK